MNIAYWNIHGLNEDKLEDGFLVSSVCKYDIVCFRPKKNMCVYRPYFSTADPNLFHRQLFYPNFC